MFEVMAIVNEKARRVAGLIPYFSDFFFFAGFGFSSLAGFASFFFGAGFFAAGFFFGFSSSADGVSDAARELRAAALDRRLHQRRRPKVSDDEIGLVGSGVDATTPPAFERKMKRYLAHAAYEQCVGNLATRRRRHKKPFVGISDIGQLTFCEIQSTVSQIAMQAAYVESAFSDDRSEGIGVFLRREITAEERADAAKRLAILSGVGSDVILRRAAGGIAESVELSGMQTERRHFDFGEFYVIGRPDALTAAEVVEFARSAHPRLAQRGKCVQCNLYAVLWQRPSGQAIVVSHDGRQRIEVEIEPDPEEAERWVLRAWRLLSGAETPRAPDYLGKCRSCIYNARRGCPFPGEARVPTLGEMKKIANRFGS